MRFILITALAYACAFVDVKLPGISPHSAVLRKTPSASAPKVASLDHDIVMLLGQPAKGWRQVRTAEGATGWIPERDLRSPLDYRAFFEKRGGAWKLTALISGD